MKFRTFMVSGVCLTAVMTGAAIPVAAQTTQEAAGNGEAGIADIVVTANRREESGQRVPIAVTVLNADALRQQGVVSSQDLMSKIPSVVVGPNATQRSAEAVTIRGQGQTSLAAPGVVKYFDEVPLITGAAIGNQGGPGTFFDVGSVQVLRGPQGTLFGRNTTGGALLISPTKPVDRAEGYVSAQIGNYRDREFEAVVNAPVVPDRLFVRVGFNQVDRNGFTRDVGVDDLKLSLPFQGPGFTTAVLPGMLLPGNFRNTGIANLPGVDNARSGYAGKDYDDRHYTNVRLGVVWKPAEGVENYFQAFYTNAHNNGTGQVLTAVRPNGTSLINLISNAYGGNGTFLPLPNADVAAYLARQQAMGPRRVSLNNDQFEKLEVWGLIDTLSVDLSSSLTFRNIVSYQRMTQNYAWDLDGSYFPVLGQVPGYVLPPRAGTAMPADFPADSYVAGTATRITDLSQVTAEPQLQGRLFDDQATFVLGGFYSYVRPQGPQGIGSYNGATFGTTAFAVRTRSKAVYGQTSIDLGLLAPSLKDLKVTLGGRQTWDETRGSRSAPSFYNIPFATASLDSSAFTWNVGLDYRVTSGILLYGKASKGYKSGGFNFLAVRAEGLTYQPEHVRSYEIGMKTDFRLGAMPVRLNLNAYNLDYKNIQRAFGDAVASANPQTGLDQGQITYNIGGARIRGIELEASIKPFPDVTISGNYAYTKGKYTDYKLGVAFDPLAPVKDTCNGPVTLTPAGPNIVDLNCIPFSNVAKNQFSVNGRYEKPLPGVAGILAFSINYSWMGPRYQTPSSTPADEPFGRLESFGLLGAGVEWNGIMGTRLDARIFGTNLTNKVYRISSAPGYSTSLGYVTSIYGEPRMYGLSLRYHFGE
ncbi:iron complex outermembrane receptor protein [Sphingobium sp. OAS761]|uniref:TonB-dependent receptor n=1 Tax=Sphingobium sp. OAS761 TaxID=2817901 RepID=UPI0020A010A1|nr:TonB-dependent receptor [Sphingobium sp. OAS761]MCP1470612.1 iron complex outermembrane receptor protein [Sphingobium sp. OAS761]